MKRERKARGFEETLEQHGMKMKYSEEEVPRNGKWNGAFHRVEIGKKPLNLIKDDEEEEE